MLTEIKSRYLGKKILVLFLIMTAYIFSQSWNSTITTSINEPNAVKMDLFTNRDGNYLIVQNSNVSNSIKYYLLNSSGSLVRSATIETSGGAEFPNISGDNDKVYIVYKLGSNLKGRKSTNAGISWSDDIDPVPVGNNICNGVDIVYDTRGLHVVYAMRDNYPNHETYYRLISDNTWGSREDVTGYENGVGGFPTIAVSSNRVHVGYNTGTNSDPFNNSDGYAKTRDRHNLTWQTPQAVTQGEGSSSREKVQVRTSRLYNFYYEFWCDLGFCGFDLQVKSRDLDETSWSSPTSLNPVCNPNQFMGAEQTANSELHVVYGDWGIDHRYYNGTPPWSTEYLLTSASAIDVTFGFSYASNDLYSIWKDRYISNLQYAQYDATPLAPINLSSYLDPDPSCNNCHGSGPGIRLDWVKNNEPDLYYYTIFRSEGTGCNLCHGSGSSSPPDSSSSATEPVIVNKECPALQGEITNFSSSRVEVETVCLSGLKSTQKMTFELIWAWSQNYWVDKNIQEDYTYTYFVTAKDVTDHESGQSNFTSTYVPQGLSKGLVPFSGAVVPKIFFLYQNYPNPFNPATTIRYQVPKKTSVVIEIFNLLGQKVRTLVNEFKAEGYYSVEWNGKNDFEQPLPSGIYLYQMTAGSYSETKKMLFLK